MALFFPRTSPHLSPPLSLSLFPPTVLTRSLKLIVCSLAKRKTDSSESAAKTSPRRRYTACKFHSCYLDFSRMRNFPLPAPSIPSIALSSLYNSRSLSCPCICANAKNDEPLFYRVVNTSIVIKSLDHKISLCIVKLFRSLMF